ncbi:MAG: heavy metal-binding domain-containing protein [Segetibacter sp.]
MKTLKGEYYCPMHCEGDKPYDKARRLPCVWNAFGKSAFGSSRSSSAGGEVRQYTCPMHPQIIRDAPGSCPICGMDLSSHAACRRGRRHYIQSSYCKKFIVAVFSYASCSHHCYGLTFYQVILYYKVLKQQEWNWMQFFLSLPVVFYATWMFFQKGMEINCHMELKHVYINRNWYRGSIFI